MKKDEMNCCEYVFVFYNIFSIHYLPTDKSRRTHCVYSRLFTIFFDILFHFSFCQFVLHSAKEHTMNA